MSAAPDAHALPDFPALARLKRDRKWVAWKREQRNGKPTKVPVSPHTGRNASVNIAKTWGIYDQAVACARRYKLPGVG